MADATLVLEDGLTLRGEAFGARGDAVFELVFNTSMTGYQEILTDPSYRGQGVLFTTPHIGNTGINHEDNEAPRPQASAVVVRAISPSVSNWRSACPLPDWMAQAGLPGISGVDTRMITRKLRDGGTLKAALSTAGTPAAALLAQAHAWPGLDGRDTVQEVTCTEISTWSPDPGSRWLLPGPPARGASHIVLFDFGAKHNIARHVARFGHRVTIVPAYTTFEQVMALSPDGILLSNGPGDPAGLPGIVAVVRALIEQDLPIFGICLGHQLIGRAMGARTVRLKFGHHSGNHPVQDRASGLVQITAQNHNYAVDPAGLDPAAVEVTHCSLNDGTVEGLRLRRRPVFSVQYHPEAAPGPHDAHDLFAAFDQLVRERAA
jgi:carbamoyl-phosphate synthase small subunit